MLRITKDEKEANLITHGSKFHPDDVFSTAFLSRIVENPVVYRSMILKERDSDDKTIVYDIGFGRFDHHGANALWRNDKIKYCSFGLLWKEFGRKYLDTIDSEDRDLLFKKIDEELVMQIDGIDNGVFPQVDAPYKLKDLDNIIDLFNNSWLEDEDSDIGFMEVVSIANRIIDRVISREEALIKAKKIVEGKLNDVKDNILVLDKYMPYEEALWESENPNRLNVKVIVLPSNRGGYNIKPITVSKDSKDLAYHFNKEWYGLHDEELAQVSRIKTARFVHSTGFLASTETLEDAILMAKNAINNN